MTQAGHPILAHISRARCDLGTSFVSNSASALCCFVCGASALAGCYLGSFVSLPIWGALCDGAVTSSLGVSWHLTYYLSGGLAVVWSVVWACVARSSPADDPSASPAEKRYGDTRNRVVVAVSGIAAAAYTRGRQWYTCDCFCRARGRPFS